MITSPRTQTKKLFKFVKPFLNEKQTSQPKPFCLQLVQAIFNTVIVENNNKTIQRKGF